MDGQAVKVLKDMEKADVAPDESTYNAVIGAFAKGGEWRDALKFVLTHTYTHPHIHTCTHASTHGETFSRSCLHTHIHASRYQVREHSHTDECGENIWPQT
jgi:hypothetical protein